MDSIIEQLKVRLVASVLIGTTAFLALSQPALAETAAQQPTSTTTASPSTPALLDAANITGDRIDQSNEAGLNAAYQGCGGETTHASAVDLEQRVVELTNEERARAGLPPLKMNNSLALAARYHAVDMTQDDYFRHDTHDRDGDTLRQVCLWYERVLRFVPDAGAMAENLALGYDSPEAVIAGWMASEGHRENILRDSYSEIGASYHDGRWGQNFAQRYDVYPVIINGEARATAATNVTIYAYGAWDVMRLRNDSEGWSEWQSFRNQIDWQINAVPGVRTVEIQLSDGRQTVTSSDAIEYIGPARQEQPRPPDRYRQRIYVPLVANP